jgi:cytochrome c biogenesis protein
MGREGQMRLKPGTTSAQLLGADIAVDSNTGGLMLKESSTPLPFTVTCTDIEQKLIRPNGSILANNTLDWLTRITINDEYGERQALVHLNEPYDYRGFRFFQASFISNGKARNITLRLTPAQGGEPITVTVPRDGSTTLNDGTRIAYKEFFSEFTVGGRPEQMGSADYNNPVAILTVTPAGGAPQNAFAFPMDLPDNAPIGKPIAGYKFKMVDFERVPEAHVIAVKRDPGKAPFYAGGLLLILTLGSVFFFSHQRVWALIEERDDGKFDVVLGGNTNRNKLAFEDRFNALHESIKSGLREVKQS